MLFIEKKTKKHRQEWTHKFRNNRLDYNVYSSARQRAKKRKLDFTITLDDITIPDICPVLKIPLNKGTKTRIDGSPSIDRIDNSKGYIKNNIIVVSWKANKLKGDSTHNERKQILDFYQQFEKK